MRLPGRIFVQRLPYQPSCKLYLLVFHTKRNTLRIYFALTPNLTVEYSQTYSDTLIGNCSCGGKRILCSARSGARGHQALTGYSIAKLRRAPFSPTPTSSLFLLTSNAVAMPSRRKSAHTTKIERVPRYEVYHGEEDLDDRLSSDGTLDLSMKRIKVEPPDYSDDHEKELKLYSDEEKVEMESAPVQTQGGGDTGLVMDDQHAAGESVDQSASSRDGRKNIEDPRSVADDTQTNTVTGDDHVTAQSAAQPIECTSKEFTSPGDTAENASNGSPLFRHSSKGKQVRPFKLYPANRDILSGITTTQEAPTVAAYPVSVALAAIPGAAVPLAFASVPLVNGTSMIPVTSSSAVTSAAASSAEAMGAGADANSSSTSSSTSSATAKSTSSTTNAHLMTLATEADKILRERHGSGESLTGSNQDSIDDKTVDSESICSDGTDNALVTEDGSVLKIPTLGKTSNGEGGNTLSFIQKRAVAAAVAATNPQKGKKKRQPLPEDLKDVAYWERRRKNNEAAKRSRDARRAKEDQIAIRAALLEQENIRLKIEVAALKEETAKLRSMLYSNNNS